MNNMQTAVPVQHSELGRLIKKFLHTKFGAFVGYIIGINGFNRLDIKVGKFQRFYKEGEALKKGEYVSLMDEETKQYGVYRRGKVGHSFNSRVDKGADLIASLITGASQNSITSPLPPKYVALSTSTLTAAKGDTTLTGETSASGLARALGTQGTYTGPSTLDGAASYVVSKVFTAGASATIVSAALFDAASTGNMFVEANLSSSATLANGDQLTIQWTVNL